MSSLQQINLQVNPGNAEGADQTAASQCQTGEHLIQIQASDGWNVTGKYRHNVLKAIIINKRTHSDGTG